MKKPVPAHTRRIAQLVMRPGGITVTEAVTAAEQSLDKLRDRGLAEISSTIERMSAAATELALGLDESRAGELYTLSNSLIGVAGVFGKDGLGEIALRLCTLIEMSLLAKRWDSQSVRLHVDSLRLLADNNLSPAEVAKIGSALRQVVDRLQSPRQPVSLN